MKTAEIKTATSPHLHQSGEPFFQKEGGESTFFSDRQTDIQTKPFFSKQETTSFIQTKLTIGRPGDKYEQEADAMADKVVQRMNNPEMVQTKPVPPISALTSLIQPKCTACEQEEQVQKKEGEEERLEHGVQRKPMFESDEPPPEEEIQRKCAECLSVEASAKEGKAEENIQKKGEANSSETGSSSLESRLNSSQGSGSPLPEGTRTQMESSFGADFSSVRIHTGSSAVQMNQDLHAQAFTHGSDIYFNAGKYNPNNADGQKLLAHELTHTVQQGGAGKSGAVQNRIQRLPNWVSDAAGWVGDTASDAAGSVVEGAKLVGGKVRDGAQWVGDQVSAAARWIIDRIRSLIDSGTNYLNEKWESIKEFGRTSIEDIKNGFSGLIHFVTTPLSSFMLALSGMNADILGSTWELLKSGSNALWVGINSVINSVLQIGEGIWDTVSGFMNGIFDTIAGLFDNAAFDLLPGRIKEEARSIFNGLRSLWNQVSSFWTDLWKRLTHTIKEILAAVRSFVENIMGYGIKAVISMVRNLKEVYDYFANIFADPESFILPILDQIVAKLNAEAPDNAIEFGNRITREDYSGLTTQTADAGSIQRQSSGEVERSTATFQEVMEGLVFYILRAWNQLDIKKMLWDTVVNMFWPPATIRAIFGEFSQLWNNEWAATVDNMYAPRNFFDDPIGCLYDIWSNFQILLEFPLALWRTLNHVVGLLMGYITIIIVLVEAIVGGIAAVEVGVVPGFLAGAAAGLATAAALGESLMISYLAAETALVGNAITQLFTARQTCEHRQRDILNTSSSLIGMGVAITLQILMALLAELVTAIVQAVRGIGKGAPKPAPVEPPIEAPPPAPVPEPTPAPTPRPAPRPAPSPAPGGGEVIPFPGRPQAPPASSPPAEVPIAAKFEEDSGAIQPAVNAFETEQLSGILTTGALVNDESVPANRPKDMPVASGETSYMVQAIGIDPDKCEEEECEKDYKWTRNNPTVAGNMVLRYCENSHNNFTKHGHHTWPKFIGGPESQTLMPVDQTIHLSEYHGNQGPIGGIHTYLEKYLNGSEDYKNLLQGYPLTRYTTGKGNQILINKMKTGGGNDTVLRRSIKNKLQEYYEYYKDDSDPEMPNTAYSVGLNDSVDNIA